MNYNCFARVFLNNETKVRNIFKINGAQVKKHCFPYEIFLGNVTLIWAKKNSIIVSYLQKVKKMEREMRNPVLHRVFFFFLEAMAFSFGAKKLDHG